MQVFKLHGSAAGGQTIGLTDMHPLAGLQVSVPLQTSPSLGQTTGIPGMQVPLEGLQVSKPLQALPSSQLRKGV